MRVRLALLMLLLPGVGGTLHAHSAEIPAPGSAGDVFVQLFEWRWDDVALECERVLGPAGIGAVQVSPANEHIDHHRLPGAARDAWWARYQPVSYRLHSRSGGEAAFRAMVDRCSAAGVAVYADAVLNHMADAGDRGIAGTPFDRASRRYRDFADEQFHDACVIAQEDYWLHDEPAAEVAEERAARVRRCQLGQLPDLATEREDVRAVLTAYLRDLLDTGVRGLRIDAAKHMQPGDIAALLDALDTSAFVFQEVIDTRGQSVSVDEYLHNGAVTEFLYSLRIGEAFAERDLSALRHLNEAGGLLPSEKAVVFVDNHDNQRGHGMPASTTHRDGARYQLATTFMLAWPYGYPRLMSSYRWDGVDDSAGPPADDDGNTRPVHRADGSSDCGGQRWVCEHRSAETLRMVDFRKRARAVGATEISHWWDNGSTAAAFTLRSAEQPFAFIAINSDAGELELRIPTGLPDGEYCALGSGATACVEYSVTDGQLAVALAPLSSLVLERDARVAPGKVPESDS